MKKIKYAILLLICLTLNPIDVLANNLKTNMNSVGKGTPQDCKGSEICYRKIVTYVNELVGLSGVSPAADQITGVRLTLVDLNGNRVAGKSIDFIQDQSHINYLVAAHRKGAINIISNLATPLSDHDPINNSNRYQKLSKKEFTSAVTSTAGYGEHSSRVNIFASYSPYEIAFRPVTEILVGGHALSEVDSKFTTTMWENSFAHAKSLPKYRDGNSDEDLDMNGNEIKALFDQLNFNLEQARDQKYWSDYAADDKYLVYYLQKMGIDKSTLMSLDLNNIYIMVEPVTLLTIVDNNVRRTGGIGGIGGVDEYPSYTFYGTVTEVYTMVRAQSYANYGDTTYLGYGFGIGEGNGGSTRSLFERVLPTSMYIDDPVGGEVFSFNTINASIGKYSGNMFRFDRANRKVKYRDKGYWEDLEFSLPHITPNLFFKANKSTRLFTSLDGDFYALGVGQIKFIKNKCTPGVLNALTASGTKYFEGNNCCEPLGYDDEASFNGVNLINKMDPNTLNAQLIIYNPNFYFSLCNNNATCYYWVGEGCPENCTSSNYGSVSDKINYPVDKSEWKCIYESPSAAQSTWRDFYKTEESSDYANNPYCDVYCKEEINYDLPPKLSSGVKAGRYFVVGRYESGVPSWTPIRFEGTKICRTTEIDYVKFEKNYDDADKAVLDAWDKWQFAYLTRQDFLKYNVKKTSDSTCACKTGYKGVEGCDSCCDNPITVSVGVEPIYECEDETCPIVDIYNEIIGYEEKRVAGYKCPDGYSGGGNFAGAMCDKTICGGICHSNYNDRYKYKEYVGYSSTNEHTPCGEVMYIVSSQLNSNEVDKKSDYLTSQQKLNAIEMNILKCNNLTSDYSSFKPILELSYDNPLYGLNNSKLAISSPNSNVDRSYYDINEQSVEYKDDKISFNNCGNSVTGRPCSLRSQWTYPRNAVVESENKVTYSYELAKNIYNYIQKGTNQAMRYEPVNKGANYYKLDYGILPVSLSSKNNVKYPISLKILSFGSTSLDPTIKTTTNNKFNDMLTSNYWKYNAAKECSSDYLCEYSTYKDIQTDELNVVFRPISLTNPFPGKDASPGGRPPKGKWASNIESITKNRGVNDYDLYKDKDPLYSVTLTPATIIKIREYNKNVGYIYADYNLDCTNGQNCKSKFLRETLKNMLETPLKGCVINDTSSRCNSGEKW